MEAEVARSVLVDSNLLFILVVGHTSRDHVGRARRTEQYSPEDFDLLQSALAEYDEVLVTPHVLAETSNLLGYLSEPLLSRTRSTFAQMLARWDEHYAPCIELINAPIYLRLGVTDSALFTAASAAAAFLTDDFPLYLAASTAGRDAINFTHLRQARGTL
jgi:hypothetical protein